MTNSTATGPASCPVQEDLAACRLGELEREETVAINAHAESCAACSALLDEFSGTIQALRESSQAAPAVDLVPGILAQIPQTAWSPQRTRLTVLMRPLLKLAAGILFLVGAGWLGLHAFRSPDSEARTDAENGAQAVTRGLAWLAEQQEPSGGWDSGMLGGRDEFSPALNGLAVLALARNGDGSAGQEAALRRAVGFLCGTQAADGRFGADVEGVMYNHGIATLAMLEAFRATGDETLRSPISSALAFIEDRQSVSGGWGYRAGASSRPNTSISTWQVHALLLASELGWTEHYAALRRGVAWMTGVVDSSGFFGYEQKQNFPEGRQTLTTMGASCALAAQRRDIPIDEATLVAIRGGLQAVRGETPSDYYGAFFRAEALREADREQPPAAMGRIEKSLVAGQKTVGAEAGSWDADDRWGNVGGRLYSTSMAMLSLSAN